MRRLASVSPLISMEGMRGRRFGAIRNGILYVSKNLEAKINPGFRVFLRKEVIQPQVPLRLPCYDFTPVAHQTLGACLPERLAQRLLVQSTPMV